MMASAEDSLRWSSQFTVTPPSQTPRLPGDKITLPHHALQGLLEVAPIKEVYPQDSRAQTRAFDPFNPHTFAVETRAREQGVDRQHQLPHPLTFRVVNPQNGRVVYAGIREFSAQENEVGLSAFLRDALGIEDGQFPSQVNGEAHDPSQLDAVDGIETPTSATQAQTPTPTVTVHAKQLPKGTYVRLRPLEAGYDPEDWKALLERYLRDNFTTLTTGEVLTVSGSQNESFRFLVDRVEPQGDGICVVDTDLEVDIVALTEDQARETLRKRLEKASRAPGSKGGSSLGGALSLGEAITGQVVSGEYVDYELHDWSREDTVSVEVDSMDDDASVCLFVSPLSSRQRNRPREDEHVFGDFSSRPSKHIRIASTNVELDGAEALYVAVQASSSTGETDSSQATPVPYKLRIVANKPGLEGDDEGGESAGYHEPGDTQCQNCLQWVPQRTLVLHENFCLRNNVFCPQCRNVFQKRSPEWQNHWHCPYDDSYGNDGPSKKRHDTIFHEKCSCTACGFEVEGFPQLAQHRTTLCPGKPILCQFCHLVVPQQGESEPDLHDPEVLLSGLTPHELVDGGRTTECHLCNKIIRLRDMNTHLRHHDLERLSRPPPRICLNQNCGRTLDARGGVNNDSLGLCSFCFGPLYVDTYDPEGKALRRRIERRYLTQMMTGCGKPWCQNEYCKTGKQTKQQTSQPTASMSAANILTTVRPLLNAITFQPDTLNTAPFYFCADQSGQQRRSLAEIIAAEEAMTDGKTYGLAWCIAAVEATGGNLEKAKEWLENWAPAQGEDVRTVGSGR